MRPKDQPEERGFSRPVRPDQAMNFARLDPKVDVARHMHAAKALAQAFGLQDHGRPPAGFRRAAIQRISDSTMPSGANSTVSTKITPMTTIAYWLP